LFVYGTLMRGATNHHEIEGARFLGVARTVPGYAIIDVAGFPALVPGTDEVLGELVEVDAKCLARLDAFEGDLYRRGPVILAGGVEAQAYLLADVVRLWAP
jgi:gamma-glutamylcyclotransferase (GGCT)/AIG2-like uncharacterized protein YtfP